MREFICLLLFCCSLGISAQTMNLSDSLRAAFKESPRFIGRFETRNSFITRRVAEVRGIQIGYAYGDHVSLGLGVHWLSSDFKLRNNTGEEILKEKLVFRYVAPFFEYAFVHKKRWHVSIPIRLGIGYSKLRFEDETDNLGLVLLYEPAMSVEYRFLEYFGIGGGLGYRLMFINNKNLDQNFNSPVYLLKFRILFGKLYKEKIAGQDN